MAGIASCSSEPDPLEISGVMEMDATVIAVDVQDRTLVLRGPKGNDVQVRAGPEVRNLSQVEARTQKSLQAGLRKVRAPVL
jgi:hypothetical protein